MPWLLNLNNKKTDRRRPNDGLHQYTPPNGAKNLEIISYYFHQAYSLPVPATSGQLLWDASISGAGQVTNFKDYSLEQLQLQQLHMRGNISRNKNFVKTLGCG